MSPELGVCDLRKHGVGQVLGQHLHAVAFGPTHGQQRFRLGFTRFQDHPRVAEFPRLSEYAPIMCAFIQDAWRPLRDRGHVRTAVQQFRGEWFFNVAKSVQDVGPVTTDSLEQVFHVRGLRHHPVKIHAQHRDPARH